MEREELEEVIEEFETTSQESGLVIEEAQQIVDEAPAADGTPVEAVIISAEQDPETFVETPTNLPSEMPAMDVSAVAGDTGSAEPVENQDVSVADLPPDTPPPDLSQVGKRMDSEERWYVLHTFSGYESVAEDNLKKVIDKYELKDRVKEIFIPTQDTVVEKRDKKVIVPVRTMPSYIFIKMIYGDDLWHTITRTRGITGFVGPKGRPLPLSNKEVMDMKLERKISQNVEVEERDTIQIIDGPLAGQTAVVITVDSANKKCSATVNMFGRPTNVELSFSQIKKI